MSAQKFLKHIESVGREKGTMRAQWYQDTFTKAVTQSFSITGGRPTQDEIDRRISMCASICEEMVRAGNPSRDVARNILTPLCARIIGAPTPEYADTRIEEGSEGVEYVDE